MAENNIFFRNFVRNTYRNRCFLGNFKQWLCVKPAQTHRLMICIGKLNKNADISVIVERVNLRYPKQSETKAAKEEKKHQKLTVGTEHSSFDANVFHTTVSIMLGIILGYCISKTCSQYLHLNTGFRVCCGRSMSGYTQINITVERWMHNRSICDDIHPRSRNTFTMSYSWICNSLWFFGFKSEKCWIRKWLNPFKMLGNTFWL